MSAGPVFICCCTLVGVSIAGAPARAKAKPEVPVLQRLADELDQKLSQRLKPSGAPEPVVGLVVEADHSIVGREGRIVQELERLLVYRMEHGAVVARAVALGGGRRDVAKRARALGVTLLLRCVLGIEEGSVHMTAELTSIRLPFWEWLVDPIPKGAKEHLFVSAPVDEEVLLLLGKSLSPQPLGGWRLTQMLVVPHRVLDLDLGDLDEDRLAELVLLFETAIEVYSLKRQQPKRLTTHDLAHLPEAQVRVRDPQGSLRVVDFNADGRSELFYKLFNRRVGEVLSWSGSQLISLRRLEQVPLCVYRQQKRPMVLYGKSELGTNRYLPEIEVADINHSQGKKGVLPWAFSTLRCWRSETEEVSWIVVVDLQGRMHRLGTNWKAREILTEIGAGAGVMDLDGDGEPELIVSDPVWPGQPDRVRIFSKGEVIWQTRELIGSVVAVAGSCQDRRGRCQAVVAAVEPGGRASRIYLLNR